MTLILTSEKKWEESVLSIASSFMDLETLSQL